MQCGRPASKNSKSRVCHIHGGRGNSGPKKSRGKARAPAAHTKTGEFSNAAREAHARAEAYIHLLRDGEIEIYGSLPYNHLQTN